jgi:hypothetical protein
MPSTPLIGSRISWLIVARNEALAPARGQRRVALGAQPREFRRGCGVIARRGGAGRGCERLGQTASRRIGDGRRDRRRASINH